jgi:hypothetical protein
MRGRTSEKRRGQRLAYTVGTPLARSFGFGMDFAATWVHLADDNWNGNERHKSTVIGLLVSSDDKPEPFETSKTTSARPSSGSQIPYRMGRTWAGRRERDQDDYEWEQMSKNYTTTRRCLRARNLYRMGRTWAGRREQESWRGDSWVGCVTRSPEHFVWARSRSRYFK